MRVSTSALFFCGAIAAAAPPSWAEQSWTLDKVIIVGNKSVSTDKLMAVVQERPGKKITVNDITADRDAISKVLEDAHVVGAVQPTMKAVGQKVDITFTVDDQGVQAPIVTKIAPKLDAQIFDGNTSIPSDKLTASTGLTIGEDMTNEKVASAQAAIVATYKAAKLPLNVSVAGETKMVGNGKVDVLWHVVETKAKKKRSSDDDGYKSDQ